MKLIFFLSLMTSINLGASGNSSSKEIGIEAEGLGSVRIFHEELGEPIAAPERLTVSVKCKGNEETKQAALFRLCKFDSYSYEKATKTLTLKMISGRVVHHSGEVVCDLVDHKSVDVGAICSGAKMKER